MDLTRINDFKFNVTDQFENIIFNDNQRNILDNVSGLSNVLLCSDWLKQKYRMLDFTGTTNEEAIKKILVFYKHRTFRRLIGYHTNFEGLVINSDGNVIINLGF
jgi:hypothetical protein